MALDESALPELLDALRAGDGVDLIRDAGRLVMQELIELEVTDHIGAARYERSETRSNERNGHRPRLLATQAGDIELKIPKLSHGSFFPSLLSPRRRIDQALIHLLGRHLRRHRPRPPSSAASDVGDAVDQQRHDPRSRLRDVGAPIDANDPRLRPHRRLHRRRGILRRRRQSRPVHTTPLTTSPA